MCRPTPFAITNLTLLYRVHKYDAVQLHKIQLATALALGSPHFHLRDDMAQG